GRLSAPPFPYTTLFRSGNELEPGPVERARDRGELGQHGNAVLARLDHRDDSAELPMRTTQSGQGIAHQFGFHLHCHHLFATHHTPTRIENASRPFTPPRNSPAQNRCDDRSAVHGRSLTTLVRAGTFAAVSVGVSANGHAVHSGHDVPLTGTLLGGALMFAIGWALAKRERRGGIILGWMLWGQLALHLIFALTEGGTGAHATHAAARVGEETASDPTLGMLAAHLGAALVCALWLRRGEAAAFR